MRKHDAGEKFATLEVACPDCGASMKIDRVNGAVISHTAAPRKRTFENLEGATRAMQEAEERRESLFRQSFEAEKNKAEVMDRKFAEAMRKAKEDKSTGKPLRAFDLD